MAEALRAGRPLALLASIEHPDGNAYFWTGVGPLEWDGQTWTGIGHFGGVAPVKYSSELAIQEVVFALTGVDATVVATLDDNIRNLTGIVWLACIGDRGNIVDSPYQLLTSELDYQTFSVDEDGNATISIIARTGFYTLERAIDEVWSTEDQKLTYPDDTGLDMIPGLQNQDVLWKAS